MANGYLVEIDSQEREHEAILILVENPIHYHYFFAPLGLNLRASWYLLEIREHHFKDAIPGEIDIIAGQLELVSGKIDWSKSTNYLVAIEAKLAYFDQEHNQIKSQKSSPRKIHQIRSKIEELIRLGFDKVVLLDMIANPPASGRDLAAWTNAVDVASDSMGKMAPVLNERLADSTAGHWVWPIGSVIGGNESRRGTGTPIELRTACNNSLIETDWQTRNRREEMRRKLSEILSGVSLKETDQYPLRFLDCRVCGSIHGIKNSCNCA
jgi:hypothetical protein